MKTAVMYLILAEWRSSVQPGLEPRSLGASEPLSLGALDPWSLGIFQRPMGSSVRLLFILYSPAFDLSYCFEAHNRRYEWKYPIHLAHP